MNDAIREAVNHKLQAEGGSRAAIAEKAGLTRQYVTDMLNGRKGEVPPSWQALLDALDLELVAQAKTRK